MGLEAAIPVDSILSTRLNRVMNWARRSSLWPMPFMTACCGIELASTLASRSSSARITDRQGVPLSGSDAPIFRERAHQPRAAGLIVDCHRASKIGYAACLE